MKTSYRLVLTGLTAFPAIPSDAGLVTYYQTDLSDFVDSQASIQLADESAIAFTQPSGDPIGILELASQSDELGLTEASHIQTATTTRWDLLWDGNGSGGRSEEARFFGGQTFSVSERAELHVSWDVLGVQTQFAQIEVYEDLNGSFDFLFGFVNQSALDNDAGEGVVSLDPGRRYFFLWSFRDVLLTADNQDAFAQFDITAIPSPSGFAMSGVVIVCVSRRRRQQKQT